MGVVPVTINGVAYPKNKKDPPFPVTIVGYAWITGLHPDANPPTDQPYPDHGLPGPQPHPEHPIVIPPELPPIEEPPPETPLDQLLTLVAKPPPAEGGWGWFPEYGWVYSPAAGTAGPKRR